MILVETLCARSFKIDACDSYITNQKDWYFKHKTPGRDYVRADGSVGFIPAAWIIIKNMNDGKCLEMDERVHYADGCFDNLQRTNLSVMKREVR